MAKKYFGYENARKYLYDKDIYIENYIEYMFNRCQKMFKWQNLPDSVPQKELEYMLQKNGNVFITKVDGNLYAFNGGLGGVLNEYYEPTIYTVANPYLKITKDYKIDVDGVLIRNDNRMNGLTPIFAKNAVMNCDCEISLNMLSIMLRVQFLITASDDKTRQNAEVFLSKIKNGDMSIIGQSEFFKGVELKCSTENTQTINQFIQLSQYVKASAFNEIGLNANFNMKKERLITSEIDINESALLPLVENMLFERKNACDKINAMYGTNINVELDCVWKEQADIHEKDIVKENEKTEEHATEEQATEEQATEEQATEEKTEQGEKENE